VDAGVLVGAASFRDKERWLLTNQTSAADRYELGEKKTDAGKRKAREYSASNLDGGRGRKFLSENIKETARS